MNKLNTKYRKCLNIFVVILLSLFVFLLTVYLLISPALSKTDTVVCNTEEHKHSQDCYVIKSSEKYISCGVENTDRRVSHIHNEYCYDDDGDIICPLEEYEHIHDDSCYDENGTICCGYIFHNHCEECITYTDEPVEIKVLSCGKNVHEHSSECYEGGYVYQPEESYSEDAEEEPLWCEAEEIVLEQPDTFSLRYETEGAGEAQNNDITLNDNAIELSTSNIESLVMKYQLDDGSWIEAVEGETLSADANYRIEVKYKNISISELQTSKQLVLKGIPHWLDLNKTGEILYDGDLAATLAVLPSDDANSYNLVVQFEDSFLTQQSKDGKTSLSGTLYARGEIDWRELTNNQGKMELPTANKTFTFEGDLPQRYGNISIDKSEPTLIETTDINGEKHYYLKYTITVENSENITIDNVHVYDYFTLNKDFVKGYFKEDMQTPLENSSDVNRTAEWTIGELEANGKRELTYYAELDRYYVGACSRGSIKNTAELKCGNYPRGSDESIFTPTTKVTLKKSKVEGDLNSSGSGDIKYTIKLTADANNSYAFENLQIKDFFDSKYREYLEFKDIKIYKNNVECTEQVNTDDSRLNITIEELNPSDEVTIEYTVNVKDIFLAEKEYVYLNNTAQLLSENKAERGTASNQLITSSTTKSTYKVSEWMRKIDSGEVNKDETIYMGSSGTFEIKKGYRKYQVILNEQGNWNFSSATMKDYFSSNNIEFTGYVKVELYTPHESYNEKSSTELIEILEKDNPVATAYSEIGVTKFEFTPDSLNLPNDEKYLYLLTYYAKPTDLNNVGVVGVTNNFTVSGKVGAGSGTLIGPVYVSLQSIIKGELNYNVDKKVWYYDEKTNEIYWVVKIDGDVKDGFSLEDIQKERSASGSDVNSGDGKLIGVYKWGVNDSPLDYENFSEFEEKVEEQQIPKLTTEIEGTNIPTLFEVNDVSDLSGKSFIITADYNGGKYYLSTTYLLARHALEILCYTNINDVPVVWTFHKGTEGKYYISTIDSSGAICYINSPGNQLGTVNELLDSCYFTVENAGDGKIYLQNSVGNYIVMQNNQKNRLTADSVNNPKCPLTLYEKATPDLSVSEKGNNVTIIFNGDVGLKKDEEALYAIYKVAVKSPALTDKTKQNMIYHNEVSTRDSGSTEWTPASSDDYIRKLRGAVMKVGLSAVRFKGGTEFEELNDVDFSTNPNLLTHFKNYLDPGVYVEWAINVNWDGSLSGEAIVTDYLPVGYEAVAMRTLRNPIGSSVTTEIPELDQSDDWKMIMNDNIIFYYNASTNQVKFKLQNLKSNAEKVEEKALDEDKEDMNGADNSVCNVKLQLICKVNDPEAIYSTSDTSITNHVVVVGSDGVNEIKCEDTAVLTFNTKGLLEKEKSNGEIGTSYASSKIPFTITVYENGGSLTDNSDTLPPLVDELGSVDRFYFEESSLTISYKEGDNTIYVTDFGYTITENGEKQILVITNLPANKKLTISYNVRIKGTPPIQDISIENNVYWQGYKNNGEVKYKKTFYYDLSGAVIPTGTASTVSIIKVDSDNLQKKLKGAEFEVYNVQSDGTKGDKVISGTTDSNGQIILSNVLNYNTLYLLKETKAPDGYKIENKDYYFVIKGSNDTYDTTGYNEELTEKINYICVENTSEAVNIFIKNSKEKIYVEKTFKDENDGTMSNVSGSWNFGIYDVPYENGNANPLQILTITYENDNTSYYIDGTKVNEPAFTCAELNTYYYVYELDLNKKPITNGNVFSAYRRNFRVTYSSGNAKVPNKLNSHAGKNTLYVENQEVIYRMPQTGGIGLNNYYIFAVTGFVGVIALFVTVRLLRKKHE